MYGASAGLEKEGRMFLRVCVCMRAVVQKQSPNYSHSALWLVCLSADGDAEVGVCVQVL